MVPQYLALKMITRNLERAFFPIFGILIGVASIVTILSISAGGKVIIENDLSHMGENRIVVRSDKSSLRDIEYLESLPFVEYAIPQESAYKERKEGIILFGLTEKARKAKRIDVQLGKNDIVLERKTEEKFSSRNIQLQIYDKNEWLNVKGTYTENNPLRRRQEDLYAVVDISVLEEYLVRHSLARGIIIALKPGERADEVSDTVLLALNRFNPQSDYELVEGAAAFNFVNRIKRTLGIFLTALGGIATVLGGISISNLMASQIQKRKGTIGMLMAIGADEEFIFKMFFTEAVILSAIGAVSGGVFGVILSVGLGNAIGIPSIISVTQVTVVMVLAVTMGGVFGLVPARKASKMHPVEAIKSSN